MERMFIFVMMTLLAAMDVAHAQVIPPASPTSSTSGSSASATVGPTQSSAGATGVTETPSFSSSTSVTGATAPTLGESSDLLSVPTSTLPTENSPGGSTTGSAGTV